MSFVSAFLAPQQQADPAYWCIFRGDEILVSSDESGKAHFPCVADMRSLKLMPLRTQYLGLLDDVLCYAAEVASSTTAPDGMNFQGLRALFDALPEEQFWLAARAMHLIHWDRTHQYCGICGHPTENSSTERAKTCPQCGTTTYPRISPAIIVAVVKGHELLLAHAKRFPPELHSVIAGFVEPGETFEECVRREVREEVGIDVSDIRYFGSQPWPFPDSLMVAFTAQYAGGEIQVDGVELTEAGWFTSDNLPPGPGKFSVARKLINWFVEHHQTSAK